MPLMPSLSAGAKRTSGSVRHVASSFSSTEVCFEGVSAAQQNMVLNIFKSRGGMPPCSSISRQRPCSSEKLNQKLRARGMDAKEVHLEVTKKVGTKDYPNPARTGVAYMIAPVMRGWTARLEPVTMNMPHYMFYAPGVTDADIGGKPFSLYPFMLRMSPGRDDVTTIGPHKTTGFTQLSSDEPIKPTEKFLREAGPARG